MPVGRPDDDPDRADRFAPDRTVDVRVGRASHVVPPWDVERVEVDGQRHERPRIGEEVAIEGGAEGFERCSG